MNKFVQAVTATVALHIIGAAGLACPSYSNCVCEGTLAVELKCIIDDIQIKISLLPETYLSIQCENVPSIDYGKLPKLSANRVNSFKSVTFKDCPLPSSSFKNVLTDIGVTKTMSLIIQNSKNFSNYLNRKHFTGLEDLTKLLLSVNGITQLPDNLFMDMHNLTWLNIRSNGISLSEKLFKPLERLETLEISHNHMTNLSANLFSHLSLLRKLSLWQNNVTRFSKDLFTGVDVLEELDLSSNGLNELPSFIFSPLRKLKKLTLFSNKFSSLPPNLFQENEQLDTIIIFNNNVKIQQLPSGLFNGLSNLNEVYIQRCGLELIPYDVFANSPKITNISLAYNEIERLPEAVFNDQINLLELDLSNNKIRTLPEKIFSSLVKLEKLVLSHNVLEKISGSTFSSLLSLIYLDMEQNNLKKISSYLFCNNKQRMTINMAYNRLDFEEKTYLNNSIQRKRISPFARTYNLRLLNMSHNEFKLSFDDWWLNGHENLDISFNNITKLVFADMSDANVSRQMDKYHQKPLKRVWIDNNQIHNNCECDTISFLRNLKKGHTKGVEPTYSYCVYMTEYRCDISYKNVFIAGAITTLILCSGFFIFIFGRHIRSDIKKILKRIIKGKPNKIQDIIVTYSDKDEDFVIQEILPELTKNKNLNVKCKPIFHSENREQVFKSRKTVDMTLIIFSPNYLTTVYSNVNIKEIKSNMMKSNKTIYIFLDTGTDNSVYAFLKDQRNKDCSLLWEDADLWNQIFSKLSSDDSKNSYKKIFYNDFKPKLSAEKGFGRLPEGTSALDTLLLSQV